MNLLPHVWIDTPHLTVYNPWYQPLSFVCLEVVVIACAVITLLHAVKGYRAGEGSRLFTWCTIFVYGLIMEIASYNALDNFVHGQFTVMFYHRKLPLYISVLYPLFLYTSIYTIERLKLSRLAYPFVVGFVIVVMDYPFDVIGPAAGWWSWSDSDPVLAYRWHGVPVTSYYWHLAFGGTMAGLTRQLQPYTNTLAQQELGPKRFWKLLLSLPVSLLTIVIGVLLFLPFHGLKSLGIRDGILAALLIVGSAMVGIFTPKTRATAPDVLLRWIPALYFPFFAVMTLVLWQQGVTDWGEKGLVIGGMLAVAGVVHGWAHAGGKSPLVGALVRPADAS